MQVTHANDFVTHAVIGGKESIGFGISDSAEFFHILSSTLYSDQILAVVREVLCNAWDAHKDAGCTDKPLHVTITRDKFVVQDFGHGIAHEMIGPIYGTYGGSTKKNDGKQTGGFGLGCKAPFAYTDHFEVISSHKGEKTIYAMSKSSAQVGGKPEIKPIASFPTIESGITVSLNIKDYQDFTKFIKLANRIIANGEMNVLLDGKQVEVHQFSLCKNNYLVQYHANYLGNGTPQIMVRYGDVIYPVDSHEQIASVYTKTVSCLNKLNNNRGTAYSIVLLAPPNSITVTPSRESLSMQDHTVNTLKNLLTNFVNEFTNNLFDSCSKVLYKRVDEVISKKEIKHLLDRRLNLVINEPAIKSNPLTNVDDLATNFMMVNYPGDTKFKHADIANRVSKLASANLIDRGLAQTYLRYLAKHDFLNAKTWVYREVFANLITKILVNPNLDHNALFIRDSLATEAYHQNAFITKVVNTQLELDYTDALLYLRKIVVITRTMANYQDRLARSGLLANLDNIEGIFIYKVGKKESHLQAAKDLFTAEKMTVIDLTGHIPGDVIKRVIPPEDRVPKRIGIPTMGNILNEHGSFSLAYLKLKNPKLITKPEFYIKVSLAKGAANFSFPGFCAVSSKIIAKLFGDKGGVITSTIQENKYIALGAIDHKKYVIDKVSQEMMTNPRIREYYEYHPERATQRIKRPLEAVISIIYAVPELRKEFDLKNNLNETDLSYIELWEECVEYGCDSTYSKYITNTVKYLQDIPFHQANIDLLKKINSSLYLGLLDIHVVRTNLLSQNSIVASNTLKFFRQILSEQIT